MAAIGNKELDELEIVGFSLLMECLTSLVGELNQLHEGRANSAIAIKILVYGMSNLLYIIGFGCNLS